jgi:hypothetical protein
MDDCDGYHRSTVAHRRELDMNRIAHWCALAIPAVVALGAAATPVSAQTVDGSYPGGGAELASVTWNPGTEPTLLLAGLGCPQVTGHLTASMEVAFQAGSATYDGPMTFDSDFTLVSGDCNNLYFSQADQWVNPTLSGSSTAGTLSCSVASEPAGFTVNLSDNFSSAVLANCSLNKQPLPALEFDATGLMIPTSVDTSGFVNSAVASAVLTVRQPS